MTAWIHICLPTQTLTLQEGSRILKTYPVSTGKNGAGELMGSEKTPRGWHEIYAKIGEDAAPNTVFVSRKPTSERYSDALKAANPQRDWILTRILQLSGLEPGKNQGGEVDTLSRYIYIHGCPDNTPMQIPGSHGCIRMQNADIIELFTLVPTGTKIEITE